MEVRLVVQRGATRSRTIRLKSEETIIGRRQDCDLRIKSAEISRRHCLLSIQDGCLFVEDLDSVNGTFVNGERVSGRMAVRPGDELELGPVRFLVEYEITQDALDRLERQDAGQGTSDELEALPVVEDEGDFVLKDHDDDLDELPLAEDDEDTAFVPPQVGPTTKLPTLEDEEEALPVVEEIEEGGDWHLPQANDLRDLLSQMDEPKKKGTGGH